MLYRQGKYAEALPLAQEALRAAETGFGPVHVNVARALYAVAILYHAQGRYAEAEPLYLRCLTIAGTALGPDDPNLARIHTSYALLLRDTNRTAEAEAFEAGMKELRARHSRATGQATAMGQRPESRTGIGQRPESATAIGPRPDSRGDRRAPRGRSPVIPMLFVAVVIVAVVIAGTAVVTAVAKSRAEKDLEERLQSRFERALQQRLEAIGDRLERFEGRLMKLERELRERPEKPAVVPEPVAPPPTPRAAPAPTLPPKPPALPVIQAADVSAAVTPTSPTPPISPSPSRPFDWESLISVRAFAWLGGGALFLGAALFLQYSIQHGLISPAGRVAIGLLVGASALAGGDWIRAKAHWSGQAISGAGVAILYASIFAAHARYGLLGVPATFAGMVLVTIAAGVLAVRRNAFVLAVLGLLGGFLTPYLLSTREDHPVGLFVYVLLLDLGVLAVARRRHWLEMSLFSLVATAILYTGWAAAHLNEAKLPWALIAAALLAALFASFRPDLESDPRKKEVARAIPVLAATAPLLLAIAVSTLRSLAVAPAFLVVYLLVLGAGAWFVSVRTDFAPLTALSAAFSVIALATRVDVDVFPARQEETLSLFAILPIAYLAGWVLRRNSQASVPLRTAAAISLAGALPILLRAISIEEPAEPVLPLWLFAFGHVVGILVLASFLASGAWIVGSQTLLYVSLLALASRYEPSRLMEFLPLIAGATIVFWALPFLGPLWRIDRLAWLSSAASPIVHFPVLYVLAKPVWGTGILGAMAVLLAVASLVSLKRAAVILDQPADRRFALALFGASTLIFVTAAIPILLDKEWITVAWALEAAALAWLATRIPEEGLVKASVALAAAAFVRLVLNPLLWGYHPRSGTPIVNWYLYTFGVPAVAFLLAARWISGSGWARSSRLPEVLRAASGILLFVLLNVEIADFYSTGVSLTFRLSGGGLGEDMTYSLSWGLFAIGLLFLGLAQRSKLTRAAALLVLLLTIGKVFLHDLWNLGALYRVGSIVGLAIALLAVSFLTQRFVLARERP